MAPPSSKRTHAPVTHAPISTTESPRPPMPPHSAHWLWMNAQSISETVCLQLVDGSLPRIEGLVKDGAKPWSALRSGEPQGTSAC
jgi:hypothetical protein